MSDDSSVDVESWSRTASSSIQLSVVMTDFSNDVRGEAGTGAKCMMDEDLELFSRSFEILFYANGCGSEHRGFVSTLFLENKQCPLSSEVVSFTFSCILSVADNAGKSRFPQSFTVSRCAGIDEDGEAEAYAPFGLERFIEHTTITNNPEEFLSDDKLTITLDISLVQHFSVDSRHSLNIFLNMKCDEDIRPVQSPDGTTRYELSFEKPLFFYLTRMSPYFRRIKESPLSEASSQSMSIPGDECEAFRQIAVYVSTGSLRHVEELDDCAHLYVVADKYRILKLKNACSEHLKNHLSHQNAFDILSLADSLGDKVLGTAANRYITADLRSEVLESNGIVEKSVSVSASEETNSHECRGQLKDFEMESYFS